MKSGRAWIMVLCGTFITLSSAFGQTLTKTTAPANYWWSIASSADGNKLVALIGGAPYAKAIYTSSDSGASWTSNGVPSVEWWSVASSADGMKLVAAAYGSGGLAGSEIYVAVDRLVNRQVHLSLSWDQRTPTAVPVREIRRKLVRVRVVTSREQFS